MTGKRTPTRKKVQEALSVLRELGLPKGQQNERSALTLLALADVEPLRPWAAAVRPLLGVTPIMKWIEAHCGVPYAPNTRETIRRQTLHQFVDAGLVVLNPDAPERSVNSPHTVYQLSVEVHEVIRNHGTDDWRRVVGSFVEARPRLADLYAKRRDVHRVPVALGDDRILELSAGAHSELIKQVIEVFSPTFLRSPQLLYVGDTGAKWVHADLEAFRRLGASVDPHGKMPDLVIFDGERNWLVLVEAVTSHGPVTALRQRDLATLFAGVGVGVVYVSAFPDRATMTRHWADIAWDSEIWLASDPAHLIHLNGDRFLGPRT